MSEVVATVEHVVRAPAERVKAALADYEGARRRAMPEQFSDYRVEAGGTGAGTRVHWRFAATAKCGPVQPLAGTQAATRTPPAPGTKLSLVTKRTNNPAATGASRVRWGTTWN